MSSTAIDEGAPLPSHTASLSETAVKDVDHVLSREYRLVVPLRYLRSLFHRSAGD